MNLKAMKILDDFQAGSTNVLAVSTKINESKVKNYDTIRRQISDEKMKILKIIEDEEFALRAKIDQLIDDEKK
jgi:alkyl hydroperoxide reductase subunit AhpC